MIKIKLDWGALVAHLAQQLTLGFGSGCDLRVLGSSPVLASVLGMESAWNSLSPSPSALPLCTLSLSLK